MSTILQSRNNTRLGGFGYSTASDGAAAGREAVLAALGGRSPLAGDLVIIFPSASYDLHALHQAALDAAGPAAVVGCTTVGAFTDQAQVPLGCVACHISGGDISFGVCHRERDDADIAGSTRAAAEIARSRAGERHPHSVLMLLCDAFAPDHRAVARGAYEVTGALIPMVGGIAGDDLLWRATHTFGEGRILTNGLLAVWLNAARPMAVSVEHGWRPIGTPMLVTRAEGSIIRELDGIPALEAYLSERGAALGADGRSFGERCRERPIGLPNASGGYDLRQIHETVAGGGLVLTTAVPEQTAIRIMASDQDLLLQGARRAAESAAQQLDTAPRLALVFDCWTRGSLLGDRIGEEVHLIAEGFGGVPTGGFYTCGELARVSGSTGIHNSSVAILAL